MEELRAELERERRNRELSERDSGNFSKQITDLRQENQKLRDELAQIRAEAQDAKVRLARYEGERQVIESQRAEEQRAARIRTNAALLIQSLRQFGAVRESERGITVTLPENLWLSTRELKFAQTADAKIEKLAAVLSNNPDYRLIIEAHTDDKGSASELQSLTDERARLMSDKLAAYGISQSNIEARGMGATLPVASNATPANRAKNRRTEITLVVADNPPSQAGQ
jgi:outer membrane protein OmpA-like peptidoglycan-associated protein